MIGDGDVNNSPPTHVYALFREMERTSVWLGMRPAALWVRIAPEVPPNLRVDEKHLRPFLMRLAAVAAVASSAHGVCVDVQVRPDPGYGAGKIRLRFEIRYADSLPSGWRELGAVAGISMLPEGPMPWIEIHAGVATAEDTAHVETGRVVTVGIENETYADYASLFQDRGIQIAHCRDAEGAARVVSQGSNGFPIRAVLLSESLLPSRDQHDIRATLVEHARAGGIPVYMVSGAPVEDAILRRAGITARLPKASMPVVSNILAIVPMSTPGGMGNVAQLPRGHWRDYTPRPPAVLVADDVQAVRLILGRVLESLGYVAHTARSGEEALTRLLDESVHRYQAAILDISMPPGMSGPEVIRRYRTRRPHSRLPMIVLTANDSRESQILAADAGADAFLSKPVSAESLRETLQQLLSVDRAADEPDQSDAVTELPTVDWAVLAEIEKLYDSESDVARLISAFSADANERIAEMSSAMTGPNQAALRAGAQALKSLAAGIGARRLADRARRIEELLQLPNARALAEMLDQLRSDLADVIAMLSGLRR